jgi:hypothetical protein
MTAITRTTRRKLIASACSENVHFLENHRTLRAAYESCTSPSALCWAFEEIGMRDDKRLRDASREIALSVFSRYFSEDDPTVAVVFRWLRFGLEEDKLAARSAARSAAESAAESAAWSAAESAACDTIRKHLPWGSF